MKRIRLFSMLVLGLLTSLGFAAAAAQERARTTTRIGTPGHSANTGTRTSGTASSVKLARVPNTKPAQSSSKASHSGRRSTTPQTGPADVGSAAALQALEAEQVKGLEQERIQADLKKDRSWFQYHLADELTSTTPEGLVEDKAHAIATSTDVGNAITAETYDELTVRSFGDVIVATGKISQTGKNKGGDYTIQRRFTHVWTNQNGRWQQVAAHTSAVQDSAMIGRPSPPPPAAPQSSSSASPTDSPPSRKAPTASPTSPPKQHP